MLQDIAIWSAVKALAPSRPPPPSWNSKAITILYIIHNHARCDFVRSELARQANLLWSGLAERNTTDGDESQGYRRTRIAASAIGGPLRAWYRRSGQCGRLNSVEKVSITTEPRDVMFIGCVGSIAQEEGFVGFLNPVPQSDWVLQQSTLPHRNSEELGLPV